MSFTSGSTYKGYVASCVATPPGRLRRYVESAAIRRSAGYGRNYPVMSRRVAARGRVHAFVSFRRTSDPFVRRSYTGGRAAQGGRNRMSVSLRKGKHMGRSAAAVMAWGRWFVLAVALTGCASTSFTPGSRVDHTQLLNALEADNVDYVRSAIQGGALNPNERIP